MLASSRPVWITSPLIAAVIALVTVSISGGFVLCIMTFGISWLLLQVGMKDNVEFPPSLEIERQHYFGFKTLVPGANPEVE